MNMKAEVVSISGNGSILLRSGLINMTANREDIIILSDESNKKTNKISSAQNTALRSETMSSEIDLRGMDSIEAVYVTEQFIDNALMARLNNLYIIHGKGTGKLRSEIHKMLKNNKSVKSFRLGSFGEGEDGVTVVELK